MNRCFFICAWGLKFSWNAVPCSSNIMSLRAGLTENLSGVRSVDYIFLVLSKHTRAAIRLGAVLFFSSSQWFIYLCLEMQSVWAEKHRFSTVYVKYAASVVDIYMELRITEFSSLCSRERNWKISYFSLAHFSLSLSLSLSHAVHL